MIHNNNPKGSEWNKWDMHVHTPASILHSEFGADWDNYVKVLFKKAISKKIVAIGITDYYFIDGYKIIKEDYLLKPLKLAELFNEEEIEYIKSIFIFPNIEFRIDKMILGNAGKDLKWNKKVNYHLLFSDSVPISKIEELIRNIKFETPSHDGKKQSKTLSKENLIELGEELQKNQTDFQKYTPIKVGMMNIAVDTDSISDLLENEKITFKNRYLFGFPPDEDLSIVNWSSQGHLARKNLLTKAHLFFSSNPKTIEFALGKMHSNEESFLHEFNSFKPCVWGSDAHSFEKLFEPENNRYTWIKAVPSFEGLRQILFEPKDRVCIQQNIPDNKTPYLVIDKVRFVDKTDEKIFQSEWIELNDKLNVIIGGKSSGKSLLLYHIAKSVDAKHVEETDKHSPNNYLELLYKIDFEVVWKNQNVDSLHKVEKQGQVSYIPQLYINHLAEKNGKEHLYKLILSILQQNDSFKEFYEVQNKNKQEAVTQIGECIRKIFVFRQEYQDLQIKIKSIGTQEQISGDLSRLEKDIEELRNQSGFTHEEENVYQELISDKTKEEKNNRESKEIKSNLEKFITGVAAKSKITLNALNSEYNNLSNLHNNEIIKELKDELEKNLSNAFNIFLNKANKRLVEIDDIIKTQQITIHRLEQNLKPYLEKVSNKELMNKNLSELEIQNQKKQDLENKTRELKNILTKGTSNNEELFEHYSNLVLIHNQIIEKLLEPEFVDLGDELLLKSKLDFDVNKFSNSFTGLFDLRNPIKNIFNDQFKIDNNFIYDQEGHVGNIKAIFDKLPKNEDSRELTLKTYTSVEDLYTKLFDDYFKIDFSIEHKGDNILTMSPGKRGIVLLHLILHISNAVHPILIDQPEDNLDNRTIYSELKQFIKERKNKRQIILVTHNANLVVSTDAENVIIANQRGQQKEKENKEFKFEYVSGALENTFKKNDDLGILFKYGIREHVCDILEGGEEAFLKREQKYGLK